MSEIPDFRDLLYTSLRVCGAGAVTVVASCVQLTKHRERPRADAIVVDSVTSDLDATFLRWASDHGAAVIALTLRESDRRDPEWLRAFDVRLLHSTDIRALCGAIREAVVAR